MPVKIKLTNGATELKRGTEFSTGLDLRARGYSRIVKNDSKQNSVGDTIWFDDNIKEVIMAPMERILIKTGVHIEPEPPEEREGNIYIIDTSIKNRSGFTLKDGILCNLGVIDCDYRGDVGCSLINLSTEPYIIKENQAIGQLCFNIAMIPKLEYVEELNTSIRGTGAFGSTGV